jgi:calcineurin-like phosphoesterase family protein
MSIFFTADTHFSHRRIPAYTNRRFCLSDYELSCLDGKIPLKRRGGEGWIPSDTSLYRHDKYLIEQINQTVGENDTLWHLGDFCFSPHGREREFAESLRNQINCKNIFLCWGNHDRGGISVAFTRTYQEYTLKMNGQTIRMAHEAKLVFYDSHRGGWNLYGHSHATVDTRIDELLSDVANLDPFLSHFFKHRRAMDVGIDNAFRLLGEYRPFSFDEIKQIMDEREGASIDVGKEVGDDI